MDGCPAFIHTHDRYVESRVLEGELTNIRYDVREVTLGGDRFTLSSTAEIAISPRRLISLKGPTVA